ncbi:hypothetical protein TNCV_1257961 [Trichonephila clavipes]|nr:hypothetical protein TNCV_1257961 [Trichonephila clavipes]
MISVRGHGAIVYCLSSGSDDSQTGRHNGKGEPAPHLTIGEACLKIIMSSFLVLREGDNRIRRREKKERRKREEPGLGWRKHERGALVGTEGKRALEKGA